MSKQLFLVRHAQAESVQMDSKDIDRALTPQGCQDAMRMGKLLHENGCLPELIISSTAERTKETSRYICEQMAFDIEDVDYTEDLYESSVRLMLGRVNQVVGHINVILMIAHNPSISYLAEYLTGDIIGNVPPGGVVHLSTKAETWQEVSQNTCELIKFYDPILL